MSDSCSSCGAEMFWCSTRTGEKLIPLDCRPDPLGLLVLRAPEFTDASQESFEQPMRAIHVSALRKAGETVPESDQRYTAHFATCPHAASHRKKRKS